MHVTHFHKVEKMYKVIHLLHKTQNFFILNKYIFTSIVPLAVHKSIRYLFFHHSMTHFCSVFPKCYLLFLLLLYFLDFTFFN